jgi:hypothetical protein
LLLAHRLMAAHIALVGAVTGVYLTVPGLRAPLWAVIALAGVVAVLAGVHVHRPAHRWPWRILAAGLLAFAAGHTYSKVQETYFHAHPLPSPSLSDACHLAVYVLLITGLFGLARYRRVGRDLSRLLDALIIAAGLALPVWVYLVQPLAGLEGLTWQQRAISIASPLGDVLILAMLVALLAPGPGSGSHRAVQLLVLGTSTLLCFDIAHGILRLNGMWQGGTLLDSGWIVFYTAWGLAALHPSMAELTASKSRSRSLLPPWRRLLLLTAATLIPIAVLVREEGVGRLHDATALAVASGVLFVLVILRLAVMVAAYRKAVAREQALRTAAASLVGAFWPEEVAQACAATVTALFGPKARHATLVLSAQHAEDLYTRLNGEHARTGPGSPARRRSLMVPVTALGPDIAAQLADVPTALVCPMVQPDRPAGDEPSGVLLAAGPERRLAEMRGSLEILASHARLAAERIALRGRSPARRARRTSAPWCTTLRTSSSSSTTTRPSVTPVRPRTPCSAAPTWSGPNCRHWWSPGSATGWITP